MANNIFKATITVLDKATAPLTAINAKVAALTSPLRQVGNAIGMFGQAAGFGKIADAARNAGQRFAALGRQIGGLLRPLAAIGGIVGIGGLIELTKRTAEYGNALYVAKLKTGASAQELAKWHFAGSLFNVDAGLIDKGLERLNRTIGATVTGKNQQMAVMFDRLHISLRDGKGHIRDASQVLGDLATAVKKNKDSPVLIQQIAMAMGMRSGAEMLPLLRQGKDGLAAFGAEAEHFGLVMSDQGVAAAHAFDESWKKVGFSIQGLSNAIGEKLFPLLQPMLDNFSEWIAANRQLIATDIGNFIKGAGNALRSINWAAIGRWLKAIGDGFAFVAEYIGPTATAIGVLALAMAPLIVAFGRANFALAQLGWEIVKTAGKFALLAFTQVAAAIGNFVTALRAGYGAMAAFDLIMDANPIGLVVLGVTALAAAAFLIWKYWKPIGDFFKTLWAGIVDVFDAAWSKIKPIVDPLLAGAKVVAATLHLSDVGAGGRPQENTPAAQHIIYARGVGSPMGAGVVRHELVARFENAPKGMRVSSRSWGGPPPDIDLGHGFAAP